MSKEIQMPTSPKAVARFSAPRLALLTLVALVALALPSAAAASGPAWKLTLSSNPTNFTPGSVASGKPGGFIRYPQYTIIATNVGTAPSSGLATITDTLPAGVTPIEPVGQSQAKTFPCSAVGQTVSCEEVPSVPPGRYAQVAIPVEVDAAAPPSVENTATIAGGGAAEAIATTTTLLTPAVAEFGFTSGQAGLSMALTDENGAAATEAGSHPAQLTIDNGFPAEANLPRVGDLEVISAGHLRDLHVDLPRGVVVNPTATPELCTEAQLQTGKCPQASALGVIGVQSPFLFGPAPQLSPLYNMVPPPGSASNFGFDVLGAGVLVHLLGGVNPAGEYSLGAGSNNILAREQNPVLGAQTVLWGKPSDPAHDGVRGKCAVDIGGQTCPLAERPDTPLLTMPSSCRSTLPFSAKTDSWEEPARVIEGEAVVEDSLANATPTEGCNALDFAPSFEAKPTTNLADSPTGLEVGIHVPQTENFSERATANFKDVTVTLPEGMTVNASGADGLAACTPAQFGLVSAVGQAPLLTDAQPASCPDAAKIGSVEVFTPLLKGPLFGALYIAQPYQNPFGSLLAIYLTIDDPATGVVNKLAGRVAADPRTGRLTTTFASNPELPIEDVEIKLFGGPRAALKSPLACGTHSIAARIVPWSTPEGEDAQLSDDFSTTTAPSPGPCPSDEAGAPKGFSFRAGTVAPQAAAYSPFVLQLSREDGTQRPRTIETTLPRGLIARLAGASYCPEAGLALARSREAPNQAAAELSSPSCPASSHVGTATVRAGAGIAPYALTAQAYLAGPYKGAPLSLALVTPVLAGPYDLGDVLVRTALYVDRESTQVHAVSDPIPQMLEGIPTELRSIDLSLDRPSFTLNPSSCDPSSVLAAATTATGAATSLAARFQVGGCSGLPFKPKLSLRLKGGTQRAQHPALAATVAFPKGTSANVAAAQVTLPHSAFIENAHFKTICTRVQFQAGQCPKGSVYGRAKAVTPLLDQPLSGPVYLRSSSHKLPDLVVALRGQIDVDLVGRVDTGKNGGIRTTFETVPDAPVSSFTLRMQGAAKGLFVNSENLCRKRQRALVRFTGQNGKVLKASPLVANDCKRARKKKNRRGGSRAPR